MVLCGLWDFINKNLPQSLPQLEHASVAQLVERRTRNEGLTSALNHGIMWLVGFYQ